MNINKYINFEEIFEEEVSLEIYKDSLEEDNELEKLTLLNNFLLNRNIYTIDKSECWYKTSINVIYIFFSETHGQNESDTQGVSSEYCFTIDSDFFITDITYSQG